MPTFVMIGDKSRLNVMVFAIAIAIAIVKLLK